MGSAQPLTAVERVSPLARQQANPRASREVPEDGGCAEAIVTMRYRAVCARSLFFRAAAAHATTAAHRDDQHALDRASAADHSAGLRFSGRLADKGMAARGGLGFRRHHRARSLERQRSGAHAPAVRYLESAADTRRAGSGAIADHRHRSLLWG